MNKPVHKLYGKINKAGLFPIRISYCENNDFYNDILLTNYWSKVTCKLCLKHKPVTRKELLIRLKVAN